MSSPPISISHRLFRCRYSNSRDVVTSSPSFSRLTARAPRRACSQARLSGKRLTKIYHHSKSYYKKNNKFLPGSIALFSLQQGVFVPCDRFAQRAHCQIQFRMATRLEGFHPPENGVGYAITRCTSNGLFINLRR